MALRIKRLIDVSVALALLILGAPLLALAAVLVWFDLGRPVFFAQNRPGLRGKLFTLYKLRTMRDAYDALGHPLSDNERLSRLGRFLRRTSIDELPQLWNVLRGELSLVGPRPLLREYLPVYSPTQQRRHLVRPGLTGWAQIHGRNHLDWEERLQLDVWYVENWSLLLDLRILWRTPLVAISGRGVQPRNTPNMVRFDDYMRNKQLYKQQLPPTPHTLRAPSPKTLIPRPAPAQRK